jgi:hypothetical protein
VVGVTHTCQGGGVEPLQETRDAIDELDPMDADDDLLEQLVASSLRVRALVPDCVGMSVSMLVHRITLTLVATTEELAGHPTTASRDLVSGRPSSTPRRGTGDDADPGTDPGSESIGEVAWRESAGTSAAPGVASTLMLPVLQGGRPGGSTVGSGAGSVIGSVSLYGASSHCFDAHHDGLAEVLGAWAGGAVTNADLSFSSREIALEAPGVLRDMGVVDLAVGLLAGTLGLDVDEARRRISLASVNSGTDSVEVARVLLDVLAGPRRADDGPG